MKTFLSRRLDWVVGAVLAVLAFALYVRTLAPSVAFLFDDTLEFQYVIPRLGILHQTGYPLYTLLGKLSTLLVPLSDPAFRLNLLSAVMGALAVALVYRVTRRLTTYLFPAVIAAMTFAVGQTFWSQAVIAETYTTQMLLVAVLLYLALAWRDQVALASSTKGEETVTARRHALTLFYALAFTMGLGLTHHRLILLLYPAIALYVLLVDRGVLKDWRVLLKAAVLFIAPLALYLYLPLRGAVGSADGTYQNTVQGFFDWAMASQYGVFLTGNPFHIQRDVSYYWTLSQQQLGVLGLGLSVIGFVWLLRKPREWALLVVALIAEAGFAFNYHVANVYVHFLTTFLLLALFVGAGADGVMSVLARVGKHPSVTAPAVGDAAGDGHAADDGHAAPRLAPWIAVLASVLLLIIPIDLLADNYGAADLSDKWDIHDYGQDILRQPLESNATVIGIQGEMTLLRYFQETEGLRPDVQTIAADDPSTRLAAIANAVGQHRVVYLTRQLDNAPDEYALSSLGPLIRVLPSPATSPPHMAHPLETAVDFGPIKLIGYDVDPARLKAIPGLWHAQNDRYLRVTLYWQATDKDETDAAISLKLLRNDQRVFGQVDHRPVLGAYPTTSWRPGEFVTDTYAVPVFLGVTPGTYTIHVTMYDAKSGAVVGQDDLDKITLGPDTSAPRRPAREVAPGSDEYFAQSLAGYSVDAWNVAQTSSADFGQFALAGYSLGATEPAVVRAGDALPLTLLWRAGAVKMDSSPTLRVWLEDSKGETVANRDAPVSAGYSPTSWDANSYVRDWPQLIVPANVADGTYTVKLAVVSKHQLLGSAFLPFNATIVTLGPIVVKNRSREMTEPFVPHALEATFDNKIKLLGYDLERDVPQRGVRLTFYWKSLAVMETPYTVFVHLLDGKNDVIVSADSIPGSGDLPTTGWIEDEYITDVHAFTLPGDLPDGGYPIEIGLYDPISGVRLKTADGHDSVNVSSVNLP